ncbi:MAG: hypothetical protein ACI8UX_001695, partial [Psychromonas sp.]
KELVNSKKDSRFKDQITRLTKKIILQRERYNETDADYANIQLVIEIHWND